MKAISKKIVSLFSCAVLLCGAGAVPTNAESQSGVNTTYAAVVRRTVEIALNGYDFELPIGGSVSIKVTTGNISSNNTTLSYQWYKNGSAISGATSSSYNATSEGEYYCKIKATKKIQLTGRRPYTNSTTYDTKTATVVKKLTITSQPQDTAVIKPYFSRQFSIGVTGGTAPYTYDWTLDGTVLPLAHNKKTINVTTPGKYQCTVTDSKGKTVKSRVAALTENFLRITSQSGDGNIYSQGGSYYLYVNAAGGLAPYRYEWTLDGYILPNNTNYLYATEFGKYSCTVYDGYNDKVTSSTMTVHNQVLRFKQQPVSVASKEYDRTATLSVYVIGGTGRYGYEWQKYVNGEWVSANCYKPEINVSRSDAHAYSWRDNEIHGGRSDLHYLIHYYTDYRCVVKTYDYYGNLVTQITSNTARVNDNVKDYITDVEFYW